MKIFYRPATSLVCAHLVHAPRLSVPIWAIATISFFIPVAAAAQSADRNPLNTQTTAPPVTYQSAFTDYKPYQDPELMSWKTANDVVREFGSMAAMGDMSGAKTPGNADAENATESAKSTAKPAHDMTKMAPQAPGPVTQKPAAPADKPTQKQTTPGHDMSKMQPAPAAPARKSSPPSSKPVAPASMPGMSH
ncbi:MAG: hypothetical protein ACYC4K_05345 [Thiobacillus sp.]